MQMAEQKKPRGDGDADVLNITAEDCCLEPDEEQPLNAWVEYYDNVSGVKLPPALVEAARKEEIDTAKNWKPKAVWKNVPRQKAIDAGKKPIGTRWVDINKGDDTNIVIRSRLLGQEFKRWEDEMMFAATPPYVCGMYFTATL